MPEEECAWWASNPQARRRLLLKQLRIPIPPHAHFDVIIWIQRKQGKQSAYPASICVRMVGVEPTRPYDHQILSLARLPLRHTRILDEQPATADLVPPIFSSDRHSKDSVKIVKFYTVIIRARDGSRTHTSLRTSGPQPNASTIPPLAHNPNNFLE